MENPEKPPEALLDLTSDEMVTEFIRGTCVCL